MAEQGTGLSVISVTKMKSISSSKKKKLSNAALSDSSVQVIRKESFKSRKSDQTHHSHSDIRVSKMVQRYRSPSQRKSKTKKKKKIHQIVPIDPQNVPTTENTNEQSADIVHSTYDFVAADTVSNRTNSSHSRQNQKSPENIAPQQKNISRLSLLSSQRVSPLNDSIETSRSASREHFKAINHNGEKNEVTDLIKTNAPPKRLKPYKRKRCGYFSSSPLCATMMVLGGIVLLAGLAALLVVFLRPNKQQTTSTTIFEMSMNSTTYNTTTSTLLTSVAAASSASITTTMTTSFSTAGTVSITTTNTETTSTTTRTTTTTSTTIATSTGTTSMITTTTTDTTSVTKTTTTSTGTTSIVTTTTTTYTTSATKTTTTSTGTTSMITTTTTYTTSVTKTTTTSTGTTSIVTTTTTTYTTSVTKTTTTSTGTSSTTTSTDTSSTTTTTTDTTSVATTTSSTDTTSTTTSTDTTSIITTTTTDTTSATTVTSTDTSSSTTTTTDTTSAITTTTSDTSSTTTTTGTSSTSTSASTSTTRTTSTTSTTTTTTQPICNVTCLNQTWLSTSSLFAKWRFENDYSDETNTYNGSPTNSPTFVQGYAGQAVSFAVNSNQMVSTAHIPLANKSFTIDAWVYPMGLTNTYHACICGICPSAANDYCLHVTLGKNGSFYTQFMGLYGDDVNSYTPAISLKNWIHVAFTFEYTTRAVSLYRNGILLRIGSTSSQLKARNGSFQIGSVPLLVGPSTTFQGYIDELSVSNRIKSSCELLEIATLAARFNFDGGSPLLDLGPNSVSSSASNYSLVSGVTLQAISFVGSLFSYFEASGFLALGVPNQPFSFSLWVQPQVLAGTLVQMSTNASGTGSCSSFIGFSSNGSLIAQVKTNTSYVAVSYPSLPLNSFSHIVQTWSSTNGLRLYINSNLVSSAVATSYWAASNWINYVTLGGCSSGCGNCTAASGNQILPGSFTGAVDDFRVYSRELTANDVCTLFVYN